MGFFSKLIKPLSKVLLAPAVASVAGARDLWQATGEATGVLTPETLKKQQREAEAAARASADAAKLAADNLAKNSLVDLANSENSPDVIAGGTAQQLGLGGDLKRKRGSTLSTQLGVRV